MNILIAEDDKVSNMILKSILESCGNSVLITFDGVELVKSFIENKYAIDIVMTDVSMPNMNGFEATQKIKKIKNVPVVLVTAFDKATSFYNSAGEYIPWSIANFYIQKPVDRKQILDVLAAIYHDYGIK